MVAAMVSKAVNAEAFETKMEGAEMMDEANHNNRCHLIDVDTSNTGSSYTLILLPASKKEKWWAHFNLFDWKKHTDKEDYAHSKVKGCNAHVKTNNDTGEWE